MLKILKQNYMIFNKIELQEMINLIKTYNKLVRDKIPEIIKNNNGIPKTKILNDIEYKKRTRN